MRKPKVGTMTPPERQGEGTVRKPNGGTMSKPKEGTIRKPYQGTNRSRTRQPKQPR